MNPYFQHTTNTVDNACRFLYRQVYQYSSGILTPYCNTKQSIIVAFLSRSIIKMLPSIKCETYNVVHLVCPNQFYTVVHKKRDTSIFSITLANIDGFS